MAEWTDAEIAQIKDLADGRPVIMNVRGVIVGKSKRSAGSFVVSLDHDAVDQDAYVMAAVLEFPPDNLERPGAKKGPDLTIVRGSIPKELRRPA